MLQMKQDDKFLSRLLSKENHSSNAESSFRVLYYGKSSGSVPFTWETKPGTPKHPLSLSSLPPLTPPPSFQLNHTTTPKKTNQKGTSKPNFLFTIFQRKPSSKKRHVSPSYSPASISSSSHSSSSFSSSSTPMNPFGHRRGWLFRSRSSAARFGMNRDDHEEAAAAGSPTPSSCLGGGHGFFRQFSTRRSKVNVKFPL